MPDSTSPTRVELITIGDELLLGFTVDTNGAHLSRELAAIGGDVRRRTTVGDDADAIAAAVREGLERSGGVITTGGLGPTSDDRTKQAIATLFGREMRADEEHVAWMRERWRERWGREMPESNVHQAMIPDGARKLVNNHGSAPGIWLEDERGRWVAMLPGVPREMRGMLADTLLPLLRQRFGDGRVVRSLTLRTTGLAESLLADKLDPLLGQLADVSLAYLPSADGVDLRLTARRVDPAVADAALQRAAALLRDQLPDAVYGEDSADLAAIVLDLCRARTLSVAVAESCTGGLLGARLTATPGSSDVFVGGVIAYDNEVKRALLGVSEDDLRAHGAVSDPIVRQMAAGARARTAANVGIAITGVAGPGGGTADKPVGTVWIAVDDRGAVEAKLFRLFGDRGEIRHRAAQAALEMVRRRLS